MTTRVLVRDIMNSPVISTLPNDTIRDIAKKMKEEKIGSIVIMEKDKPVGIVTDWDIVSNGLIKDVKPSQIKAKDAIIRGELGIVRPPSNVSGYCDECSEWSDLLQHNEGTFICEVCRGESS